MWCLRSVRVDLEFITYFCRGKMQPQHTMITHSLEITIVTPNLCVQFICKLQATTIYCITFFCQKHKNIYHSLTFNLSTRFWTQAETTTFKTYSTTVTVAKIDRIWSKNHACCILGDVESQAMKTVSSAVTKEKWKVLPNIHTSFNSMKFSECQSSTKS